MGNDTAPAQPTANAAPVKDSSTDPNSVFYVAPGAKARPKMVAPEYPDPTPTTIALCLIAREGHLKNFENLAREAGFSGGRMKAQHVGTAMANDDTGEVFVTVHFERWDLLNKCLDRAEFRIDPEHCEIERHSGSRFRFALEKLAKSLNAKICDGVGKEVSAHGMTEIAKHINSTFERRFKAAEKARSEILADGSIRVPGLVSFQSVFYRKTPGKPRSRVPETSHFEVPALPYYAAQGMAHRMLQELQQHMRKHRRHRVDLGSLIAGALGVEKPRLIPSPDPAKDNVAAAFLGLLQGVIINGLETIDPAWLAKQANGYELLAAESAKQVADGKAAFVERMRAAKAAKGAQGKGRGK